MKTVIVKDMLRLGREPLHLMVKSLVAQNKTNWDTVGLMNTIKTQVKEIEDGNCEVVLTNHGYTIMQWDKKSKDWYGIEYCETPQDLRNELLSSYRMNETEKITKARRELTEEETQAVNADCKKLFDLCKY